MATVLSQAFKYSSIHSYAAHTLQSHWLISNLSNIETHVNSDSLRIKSIRESQWHAYTHTLAGGCNFQFTTFHSLFSIKLYYPAVLIDAKCNIIVLLRVTAEWLKIVMMFATASQCTIWRAAKLLQLLCHSHTYHTQTYPYTRTKASSWLAIQLYLLYIHC